MSSKRTLEWREKNRDAVTQWRNAIEELRKAANLENWTYERLEIEIARTLQILYTSKKHIYCEGENAWKKIINEDLTTI